MSDKTATPKVRWNGRRFVLLLLFATILGILCPVATTVSKLSADHFRQWKKLQASSSTVRKILRRFPVLDLAEFGILEKLAWTNGEDDGEVRVYLCDAAFHVAALVVVVLFRRRLTKVGDKIADWCVQPTYRGPRRIIFWCGVFIVFSYPTKAFSGIFFPGIGGWTYEDALSELSTDLPAVRPDKKTFTAAEAPFLQKAIVAENGRFIEKSGFLTRRAVFLHYRDGSVLPFNYELLEFVFPNFIFGRDMRAVEHPDIFFAVLKSGLRERARGRRFLLPNSVAYPNHSVYMPIDYEGYPPVETLEKVTMWTVTIAVGEKRPGSVVRGILEIELDAR